MTEEQIERRVQVAIDRLDRKFLASEITQEQYDLEIIAVDFWALREQGRQLAAE